MNTGSITGGSGRSEGRRCSNQGEQHGDVQSEAQGRAGHYRESREQLRVDRTEVDAGTAESFRTTFRHPHHPLCSIYFDLPRFAPFVHRGGGTWKPHVSPISSTLPSPSPTSGLSNIAPVTKTSLAAKKQDGPLIGSGHNFSPKPFVRVVR